MVTKILAVQIPSQTVQPTRTYQLENKLYIYVFTFIYIYININITKYVCVCIVFLMSYSIIIFFFFSSFSHSQTSCVSIFIHRLVQSLFPITLSRTHYTHTPIKSVNRKKERKKKKCEVTIAIVSSSIDLNAIKPIVVGYFDSLMIEFNLVH